MAGLLDTAKGLPEEQGAMPQPVDVPAPQGEEMDYDAQIQDMEARVPPDMKEAWDRIMVAGMKFLFDEKTNAMVNEYLEGPGDMSTKLGEGTAGLMVTLDKESRGALPKELLIPSGIALMILSVKYMKKSGIANVTPQEYAKAIEIFMYKLLGAYGIQQQQFDAYIDKAAAQAEEK
jgi:hypothetical protein